MWPGLFDKPAYEIIQSWIFLIEYPMKSIISWVSSLQWVKLVDLLLLVLLSAKKSLSKIGEDDVELVETKT